MGLNSCTAPGTPAQCLLYASFVSSGFATPSEKGRLDQTVEAFVVQERWSALFTDEELQIARDRLAEYGYHPAARPSG
jgi:hypothetical protein